MAEQQVQIIEPQQGQYKLSIPQSSIARTDVVDVDLVLETKSGARIILPGAAMNSTGAHPPSVNFSDGSVSSAKMFSSVGVVQSLAVPVPAMASLSQYEAKKTDGRRSFVQEGKAGAAAAAADMAPLPTPAQSSVEKLLKQADKAMDSDKHGDSNAHPNPISGSPKSSAPPPSGSGGAEPTQPMPSTVSIWLGNVTGQSSATNGAGVTTIKGSGGTMGSEATPGFAPNDAKQIGAESITGTSGKDIIYVDGATYFNEAGAANTAATYAKEFRVQVTGQFNHMSELVIKGVPSDFSIGNAHVTATDVAAGTQTWTMDSMPEVQATTGLPITLYYPLDSTKSFTMEFVQTVTYGGLTTDVHKKISVQALDVTDAAGINLTDADGNSIYVLPSKGVPNVITAAAGDDTIYGGTANDTINGGAGADNMDGGGGKNTLDYTSDSTAHVINLATGTASGGEAAGDTIANFQVVWAGSGGDTITGNAATATTIIGGAGNDTMIGGTAADSFEGGAGNDTVSYSNATAGMIIDLRSAGSATATGDAAGDRYTNVETVIGSGLADTFMGATPTGTPVMDGGAGSDWIDYSGASRGVTVNLSGGTGGGDAQYDTIANIENVTGSAYNDTFTASSSANSFVGGTGNDVVNYASSSGVTVDQVTGGAAGLGAALNDTYSSIETIIGSASVDSFIGGTSAGSATMDGSTGSDWITYASAAATTLTLNATTTTSSAGNDVFTSIENVTGSANADSFTVNASGYATLDGGAGIDTVDYSADSSAHTINLATGAASGGFATGSTLLNFEAVVGGGGNDTLTGYAAASSSLYGGGGNDTLKGGSAADVLDGGSGSDTVDYSGAATGVTVNLFTNAATGGGGNDTLNSIENVIGSTSGDSFVANSSTNSFTGNGGIDLVSYANATSAVTIDLSTATGTGSGGAAGDQLVGITAVLGSIYDDTMTAASTGSTFMGGAGNDTFVAGAGTDSFDGGANTDIVTYAGNTALIIDQTAGDHGSGKALHDAYSTVETIIATSNADTFIGGTSAGSATMDGGSGSDWADYEYLSGGLGATLDLVAQTSSNAAANDHFLNLENIRGSDYADILTASATGSSLIGGAGNDTLTAANGGSTLIGGSGSDSLIGGAGTDTADYSADSTALTINLATNVNHGGNAEGDYLSAMDIIIAGSGNDTLTGNATVATTLFGGTGNDTLAGGTQGDWLDGGSGINTVDYSANSANLTVNLNTNVNAGGTAVGDRLYNIQVVSAGSGDDTLTGNATTTTTLLGGAGDDTLIGGSAGDSFDGGIGSNWVSYANDASGTGIVVNLASGTTGGWAAGDALTNIQNLVGSDYADTLTASGSGSTLLGGAGNDTLTGGAGNDTLDGGSGSDVMDGGGGVNVITYASSSSIVIDLANAGTHGSAEALGDTYANISTINATAGTDTFIGGTSAGSATMDGGAGSDWIDYEFYTGASGATVNLNNSALNGGIAANDKMIQVENIIGTGNADILTGSSTLSSTLKGGAGNDTMAGGQNADSFDGGSGNDVVTYAASVLAVTIDQTAGVSGTRHYAGDANGDTYTTVETLIGSANADSFIGGTSSGSATMDGNTGSDWISYAYAASGATLTLNLTTAVSTGSGGAAYDSFTGVENITGSSSADSFVIKAANSGYITMDGGAGVDTVDFSADSAANVINLVTSTDTGSYAAGTKLYNVESIIGGSGNDTITGNALTASYLFGGGGTDTLKGGTGADTLDGGLGSDTVDYSGAASGVTVNLNTVGGGTGGGAAGDYVANMENIIGSGFADILTAVSTGSTMTGGAGNDIMNGGAGNDTMDGGAGADTFTGNGGIDVVTYASSTTVTIDQTTTGTHGAGDGLSDKFAGIATIIATTGIDSFIGGTAAASATMDGSTGSDWISYAYATSAATLTLNATTVASTGTGSAVNDKFLGIENITGSVGYNDTFIVKAAGYVTLNGGTGTDTVDYSNATAGVTVALDGTATTGFGAGNKLFGIESLIGSGFVDKLKGTATTAETFDGGAANDTLDYSNISTTGITLNLGTAGVTVTASGGGGADVIVNMENIIGSTVNDTLTGISTGGTLFGLAGTDTLTGGAANDTLNGGVGNDVLNGGAGINTLDFVTTDGTTADSGTHIFDLTAGTATGSLSGTDTISNIQAILGGSGANTFTGATTGSYTFTGGAGADTLFAGAAAETFTGAAGTDLVSFANYTSDNMTIDLAHTIASGLNVSTGYAAGDSYATVETVIGSTHNDTFIGGTASTTTTMMGNGGIDWISYAGLAAATITLSSSAVATATGSAVNDRFIGIENIVGSGNNDTFVGDGNVNTFLAGAGADVITIGIGDSVNGGLGNDVINVAAATGTTATGTYIDGDVGTDTVSYAADTSTVTVYLGGTDEQGLSAAYHGVTVPVGYTGYGIGNSASSHFYANMENVTGGSGADLLVGTSAANTIIGGAGDDTIAGLGGGDSMDGGIGTNTLSYAWDSVGVTITLNGASAATVGGHATGDTIVNFQNVTGSTGNDKITGDGNANILQGSGGTDTLSGMGGNDTFYGGQGTETLDGGTGTDLVDYHLLSSGVTVNLSTNTNSGGAANDTLLNIEAIIGSAQADSLTAGATTVSLYGGAGDDSFSLTAAQLAACTINGGTGINTLTVAGGDLSASASHISGIQTADVHNSAAGGAYALTAAAIQQIVGSGTSSDLSFTMDSGDTFTATTGSGVTVNTTVHDATYTHYDYIQSSVVIAQIEVHKV